MSRLHFYPYEQESTTRGQASLPGQLLHAHQASSREDLGFVRYIQTEWKVRRNKSLNSYVSLLWAERSQL
jgi:hypothetical protein